ncbi:MAG: Fe-S cluster assembly protein SufD [Candidatus Aureabacteria bacterium]|nr:Fe-S cluster assembly protein SufD [Candidatus Auribacterota bacterium]
MNKQAHSLGIPDDFIRSYEATWQEVLVPEWVRSCRSESLERLKMMGFPSKKSEDWKYTDLTPIVNGAFHFSKEHSLPQNCCYNRFHGLSGQEIELVFINGVFSKEISTTARSFPGIRIRTLRQAMLENDGMLKQCLERINQTGDSFSLLNQAFFQDGIFLEVEADCRFQPWIHLVFFSTSSDNFFASFPANFLVVGQGASVRIFESYVSFSQNQYFTNSMTSVFLEEGASLMLGIIQAESFHSFHICSTRVIQEKRSRFDSFSFLFGGDIVRHNLDILQQGEQAQSYLNGLYALKGRQHFDTKVVIDHQRTGGISRQLYKGILGETARSVFNGQIHVRKSAQKTDAFQLNKNLLLNTRCRVDTKPQLEIETDDVKCSHGAAVGQLNEEELFYLLSRGISRSQAVEILLHGFADEVISRLENETQREMIRNLLSGNIFSKIKVDLLN